MIKKSCLIFTILAITVTAGSLVLAQQPQPTDPPKTMPDAMAGMNERGDKVMGFDHTKTTHHFLLKPNGGVIQIEANDAADTASRDEIRLRSEHVMALVGIDATHLRSYPHQLSGGMRQRIMIAMALLFSPDLVIMDEPTSALDVVAQRSLMVQIKDLQRQLGFAVIFVTHDMSLVSHFSDRTLVMYAGQVVEVGDTRLVFDSPAHPYSKGLLEAFPSIRGPRVPLTGIPGSPPDLARRFGGCRFRPRCPSALPRCATDDPLMYEVNGVQARCLLHEPVVAS